MRVSVIVPCYNYGRFLEEAVQSVLSQSVEDLEVIVVDDGSEDETPAVAERLARSDPRVRTYRTTNRGPAHARNLGASKAQGKYTAYLDADDRWRPLKLERQLEVIESEPDVVMLFTNAVRFDGEEFFPKDRYHFLDGLDSIPARSSSAGNARVITTDPFVELLALPMLAPTPSTTLLRTNRVRHLQWRPGIHPAEDFEYFTRVSRLGEVAYTDEILVETRRHGDNSYTDQIVPMEATIRALRLLLDRDGESLSGRHRWVLRNKIGRLWCGLGWHYFWRRKPVRSVSAYARALRYPGVRFDALKHLAASPSIPFLPSKETRARTAGEG